MIANEDVGKDHPIFLRYLSFQLYEVYMGILTIDQYRSSYGYINRKYSKMPREKIKTTERTYIINGWNLVFTFPVSLVRKWVTEPEGAPGNVAFCVSLTTTPPNILGRLLILTCGLASSPYFYSRKSQRNKWNLERMIHSIPLWGNLSST